MDVPVLHALWLCLWIQQVLNSLSWNSPHLVFNQQTILQPGLLGIPGSAFTGPGQDRAGDMSSVRWKEIMWCGGKNLHLRAQECDFVSDFYNFLHL